MIVRGTPCPGQLCNWIDPRPPGACSDRCGAEWTADWGMTMAEVANVLHRDYAVYNAINLDGGGSTSLAIDGRMVTSGNREVASSLATTG